MLLIDGNNLAYREGYSKLGLSYQGKPTNVIYGFLYQILRLIRRFPGEVCFCWDSKESFRRGFYPQYKMNRRKKSIEIDIIDILSQINELKDNILPRIGYINNFTQSGYEADDLVAHFCLATAGSGDRKIIVSSDNDLYQLLGPRTSNYNLGKKALYSHEDFQKEYHCFPSQWIQVKAIAGDTSDGIDGVPGVGIKTAIKHLNTGSGGGKLAQKIKAHVEIIARNRQLIKLPWPGCDPGPIRPSRLDEREFRLVCAEWGLGSLVG